MGNLEVGHSLSPGFKQINLCSNFRLSVCVGGGKRGAVAALEEFPRALRRRLFHGGEFMQCSAVIKEFQNYSNTNLSCAGPVFGQRAARRHGH